MSQTQTAVDAFKQWKLSNLDKPERLWPKDNFLESTERNYYLKNSSIRKFLQHEEQKFGINLGWTDDAEPETARKVARWFLTRQGGNDTPVEYGELLALGNGGKPSFIRYHERDVGINLDWSQKPVFEWKLLGGRVGEPVQASEYLALYNEENDECLMYFDRTVGGDIGWPSSKGLLDQIKGELAEALRNHARDAYRELLGKK